MRCRSLLFAALFSLWFSLAGTAAFAAPVVYHVSIDTSSIAGTAGSLDFNFNPGPLVSQSASMEIVNFFSTGSLAGGPQTFGDVSGGPLPSTLTFDNGGAFNDYFEGFTFGSFLAFDLRLFGPALSSPDGTSTSGTSFGFSMFSDPAGTIAVLTSDPAGLAFSIDIHLDGTAAVTSHSSVTSVQPVPEPGSLMLLATGLVGLLGSTRRRARAHRLCGRCLPGGSSPR